MSIYDLTCIKNDVCDKAVCDYKDCKNRADTMEVMKHSAQQLKLEILPLLQQAIGEIDGGKYYDAISPLELAVAKLSSN